MSCPETNQSYGHIQITKWWLILQSVQHEKGWTVPILGHNAAGAKTCNLTQYLKIMLFTFLKQYTSVYALQSNNFRFDLPIYLEVISLNPNPSKWLQFKLMVETTAHLWTTLYSLTFVRKRYGHLPWANKLKMTNMGNV